MPEGSRSQSELELVGSAAKAEEGVRIELLAFICNNELYAVELSGVSEIVIPPPITMVPRAPSAILGVCSVRGELATVVDLRKTLKLPPLVPANRTRILLAKLDSEELVGLLVDEVKQVERLSESEVEYENTSLSADGNEVVRGIVRPAGDSSEVIVILDLPAVLRKACR